MLKEVGASVQISLGKKYAGKLFDVILHPDDRFELIPVRVVASARAQPPQIVQVPDGWVPPGGYDGCTQWALDNRNALEYYARQIEEQGTASEQLQRFLARPIRASVISALGSSMGREGAPFGTLGATAMTNH